MPSDTVTSQSNDEIVVRPNSVSTETTMPNGAKFTVTAYGPTREEMLGASAVISGKLIDYSGQAKDMPDDIAGRAKSGNILTSVKLHADFTNATDPNCKTYKGEMTYGAPEGPVKSKITAEICTP